MVHYKLTYFNVRGYGEPARLMFKHAGIDFEDVQVTHEQWAAIKESTPFGQVPTLEVDGVVIAQSFAILRLIAKVAGLYPTDPVQAALVDSIADYVKEVDDKGFHDYFVTKLGYMQGDADKLMQEQCHPMAEKAFPIFTKWLKESGTGYLTKSGLSWADFYAAEKLGNVVNSCEKSAARWPEITAFVKKVYSLPTIKEHIASRPKTMY
uniref:Glutathione S-transferase n=1 Tax=Rhabditophanes sp. KR3021 TaxID=114890 RepID=A0AC35U388_9BILA